MKQLTKDDIYMKTSVKDRLAIQTFTFIKMKSYLPDKLANTCDWYTKKLRLQVLKEIKTNLKIKLWNRNKYQQ